MLGKVFDNINIEGKIKIVDTIKINNSKKENWYKAEIISKEFIRRYGKNLQKGDTIILAKHSLKNDYKEIQIYNNTIKKIR